MAHTMHPTTSLVSAVRLAPSDESLSARRWLYWHPWAIIEAKKSLPYIDRISQYMERHRLAVRQCRLAGLSWKVIRRHSLDDPRLTDAERSEKIQLAIVRRRDRMPRRPKETNHAHR